MTEGPVAVLSTGDFDDSSRQAGILSRDIWATLGYTTREYVAKAGRRQGQARENRHIW